MCESGIDLSCDVLVPGHHGSATATSWDFLQAIVPEYAVISCGKDNQYGHPDKDVMDKLESMDIQVYRTDKQGTIIAVSDGTTITWNGNRAMTTAQEIKRIREHRHRRANQKAAILQVQRQLQMKTPLPEIRKSLLQVQVLPARWKPPHR